ncbi:TPA: LysR family transcriptional regulator [Pseudomonas aeruginosa]|uniref:LysR family transcriptional regulator n=1 Tax=Pseudomonas aeruginosa TaxID=287 RepID=UPI001BC94E43|nr:LysR family transcriptional regulator [Pseudomonas aeruginosa]MCO2037368.1 LysR family transcriptional regulator [Pseudomonas aeruginosa]MCO2069720.1 LysR family transcriptional regulator [Pseudomonas aeruginosa]HCI1764963.1 LysR family transcriptional regulator [Pseudomonas aeruginosa]HCI1768201.1 LysR family transcriptional regulator [Pseudomonas aeruginosa]HCI2313092.1 LysR family transcriptional regulator [Pseudomonas aeruginosa]
MALSESAGQRPALLRPAQGRDDRAYWHELFGSLEVVHFFLVTARCGCFMQAARSLDVKPTLLRKTLARLEERLGLHLFVHEGNALSLTREGRIVQAAGQRLVEDSQSHADLHRQQPLVRLAVTESVLHDVLSRELWGYLRKNANLRVALAELREGWPESAGPAEIAIWIADPGQPHPPMEGHFAAPARIAELEYQPHIGKRYSRERTRPASEDELDDYLLAQLHGQAASAALAPWNRRVAARQSGVIEVQSHDLLLQAILWGACIGLLPHYAGRLERNLAALPQVFDEPMRREVWMSVQPEAENRLEVRALLDLIEHAFDDRRDWFGR